MSINIPLDNITSEQLELLLQLQVDVKYILENIPVTLITPKLVENLVKKDIISLEVDDKIYRIIKKREKEYRQKNPNKYSNSWGSQRREKNNLEDCLEYLQDQLRIKVQDKYLEIISQEIEEMKGRSAWADTITKVFMETVGCYECRMEDEIGEIYESDDEESEEEDKVEVIEKSVEKNEETKEVYIVTHYGCNSGSHDMWPPESKVFSTYDEAYAHYLKNRPSLTDEDNRAEEFTCADGRFGTVQIGGYPDGDGTCAKRPEGIVIQKIKI